MTEYIKTIEAVKRKEAASWELADSLLAEVPTYPSGSVQADALPQAAAKIYEATGKSYGPRYLRELRGVAAAFRPEERIWNLTHTHYQKVLRAPAEERSALLTWAEAEGRSTRDMLERMGHYISDRDTTVESLGEKDIERLIAAQPDAVARAVAEDTTATFAVIKNIENPPSARGEPREPTNLDNLVAELEDLLLTETAKKAARRAKDALRRVKDGEITEDRRQLVMDRQRKSAVHFNEAADTLKTAAMVLASQTTTKG